MNANDVLKLVFSRNAFYRRLHFLALGALVLNIIAIIILIFFVLYLFRNTAKPIYFASDDVGRLIQIIPVNTPNMTTEEVMAWAQEAVEAAYSYDYINYRAQLQNAEKYFITNPRYGRKYGWNSYMDALSLSGNLRALTERRQIILAKVIDKPKILAEGILSGNYAWKFEMPLLVTYAMPPYDGSQQFSNALNVTVTVMRQPILEGYKGLGILQIISTLASTGSESNQMQQ